MGNYLRLYLLTKTLLMCEFITPRTSPDDVDLYPNGTAAALDLGNNN